MANENKNTSGNSDNENKLSPEVFAKLQETIEVLTKKQSDLNQGIAKYRDESKEKSKRVEELNKKIAEIESKISSNGSEEVKLSPEEQKKFDILIKQKGILTKEELIEQQSKDFQQTQESIKKEAVDSFLENNPEFDNDEAWNEVNRLFSMYKTPRTLKGYNSIFNRIKKELSESEVGNKIRAEYATKSRLSLGGGSQKTGNSKDFENLQKKYPNLSKEQIESQLKEIGDILKE